jgi:hypothetical protein
MIAAFEIALLRQANLLNFALDRLWRQASQIL